MLHVGLVLYIMSNNVCEIDHSQSREQPVQILVYAGAAYICVVKMANKYGMAFSATILLVYVIL